ncbi:MULTISPECIES: SusC/RagA family TonB-linked outer membrane protein [Butyricimonas]|uniref:SusC/RagA family TonB-linked outer membrane protein n=1 Tax=Butyricimonas TaxID=574697 RepID=UPI001D07916E|nr:MULTISPECIES: SusC/RagA family TonB-linked outer membrane protein [Butyricimonas]MCB6971588.1 SusC/RagA family TonB-linked outer membrane protein [Butyricimonas synergistica]MCG4518804.1 SusC/RagA family TonB-linked outer membrane protein [Butyricimonas sp. DFI.6.44]
MKLTIVLTILLSISAFGEVASQNVSLKCENVLLREVFKSLKQQTGYLFVFNEEELDKAARVSVSINNSTLAKALDRVLRGLPYTYEIIDDMVVIKPAPVKTTARDSVGRKVEVKGVVKDCKGELLPGVTVLIKGTAIGVATNVNGEYTIALDPKKQSLLFSFIGMRTKEVVWDGQKRLDVVLDDDCVSMDEVVVTGYQTIDKRKLTSSISSLTDKDLDFRGALTVDQMLEGKVPGLLAMTLSTMPGAATKMRLRGSSTFTGTREPLWVIDGIIYENPVPLSADEINSWDNINLIGNAITGLNPQDIERIDVLKDASATAIYGTRAANGVIVVTTKTGKVGKTSLSYNFNAGFMRRPTYDDFELMNSKERVEVSREIMDRGLYFEYTPQRMGYEGLMMDYWDKKISFAEFQQGVSEMEGRNTDWFGALFRNSFSQSHDISLSGGNENTRYYFSFGYSSNKGTERGTDLQRLTARMNLSTRLRDNILLDIRLSGSLQDADYNPGDYSAFDEAYYTNRTIPVRNADGSLYYVDRNVNVNRTANTNVYAGYNILNEFANGGNNIVNKSLNLTASLNWEILPNLRYMGTVGLTTTTNLTEEWMGEKSFYVADLRGWDYGERPAGDVPPKNIIDGGVYSNSSMNQYDWTVRNQLNYNFTIKEIHHFNVDFGQEAKSTIYKGTASGQFPGYMNEQGKTFSRFPVVQNGVDYEYTQALKYWFLQSGGVFPTITDRRENALSFYATMTYTFKNLYSLNFNIRNDGSNRFGQYKNEKFNPVWSVSGRWNINDESFMNCSWIETLALRGSYGYRGNVPNASPYMVIDTPRKQTASGELGALVQSFPNANLKWEKTSTVNIGLDWSFLHGRISGALEYYYSKSVDLITDRPVSLVNGMTSLKINDGSAMNKGIDFNISTRNIDTENFKWRTTLSFSHTKNTVMRGAEVIEGSVNTYSNYVSGSVVKKGVSVDGFYSYQFDCLDEYGLPRFKNLTGNSSNMTKEEFLSHIFTYSGTRTPSAFGSFSTEFMYKRLSLRAEFSYKFGYKVRMLRLYKDNGNILPYPEDNMNKVMAKRWRTSGDEAITNIPALSNATLSIPGADTYPSEAEAYMYTMVDVPFRSAAGPQTNAGWYMYDYSDLRVAKGDHIRVRAISLGYSLKGDWMKKAGINGLRMDFQVQNIGVIVFDKKLKGQDPDQVQSIGMPTLPTYNLSVNVNF